MRRLQSVPLDGGIDVRRREVLPYPAPQRVVYWRVRGDGEAVPVERGTVPDPLRRRIREDLSAADVDPAVERDRL